jgi:quercetin dioxygenase-like cupin family protein
MFEGEMITDQGVVKQGDLVILPPGSKHSSKCKTGCLALIIWDKPVRGITEVVK